MAQDTLFFRQLFDPISSTYTYLLADLKTKNALLIDPVLEQFKRDAQLIQQLGFKLKYTIETHIHADHVTGAHELKNTFKSECVVPALSQAQHADRVLEDKQIFEMDSVHFKSLHTPGHTDHHMCYLMNDTLFTGDCLMINACGITDFQSGDSKTLFHSVHDILFKLAPDTKVFPAHDYHGLTQTTIEEQKKHNPRFANVNLDKFQDIMANLKLPYPRRMLQAVPKNMVCANQQGLIKQLKSLIPKHAHVLNIGQDVSYDTLDLAKHLPYGTWQIACLNPYLSSMNKLIEQYKLDSVPPAKALGDYIEWQLNEGYDFIYTERFFDEIPEDEIAMVVRQIKHHLKPKGLFCLYAVLLETKGILLDQLQDLYQAKNPQYGVRAWSFLQNVFEEEGFVLKNVTNLELGFKLMCWQAP